MLKCPLCEHALIISDFFKNEEIQYVAYECIVCGNNFISSDVGVIHESIKTN